MRAFAIDSRWEVVISDDEVLVGENADPRDRSMLAGVGMEEGTLEWRVAERSRRAAAGDVSGR